MYTPAFTVVVATTLTGASHTSASPCILPGLYCLIEELQYLRPTEILVNTGASSVADGHNAELDVILRMTAVTSTGGRALRF